MFDGGTTGKGIIMYKVTGYLVVWYYGDMVDGKREGQGGWYYLHNEDNDVFQYGLLIEYWTGEWRGDAPNGSQHRFQSFDGKVIEEDGTVVDGLCDGVWTFTRTLESGEVWTGSYTVVNGTAQRVEDMSGDYFFYWISEDNRHYLDASTTECFGLPYYGTNGTRILHIGY
jgi:hypothetical protein